jgi:hypothetical protein
MARISTYALDTSISSLDTLVGSDAEDSNITKNFKIGDLAAFISSASTDNSYTSLVQLLTQTSTNAPVATEVYNNTGETYTWSYITQGTYRITGAGSPFAVNKTIVFLNTGETGSAFLEPLWERISDAIIEVRVGTNGSITNGSFEVKIYN